MQLGIEFYATIIAAIILFLYAIRQLSGLFQQLFSEKANAVLRKYTSNLPSSILAGGLATLLLDSSSAVIILALVLINAGTIDLRRGIGISLGANIGTTVQSQLFAFDIMVYSFVLLLIGFIGFFLDDSKKLKVYLQVCFYIGMLFFGFFMIEQTVSQPKIYDYISTFLHENHLNPIQTAVAGALCTVVLQSSGSMVGIAITLAKEGLFTTSFGIAIMIGAELGTCANIIVASLGVKREAALLAGFNLLSNFVAIVIGLILFEPFCDLIENLFSTQLPSRQIANAHILFNIFGVMLATLFVDVYVRKTRKLLN